MSREDIKGAGGLASSATVTVLPAPLPVLGATPLPVPVLPPDDEEVEMDVAGFKHKLELLELANDEAAEGFSKFDWALEKNQVI